MVDTMDMVLDMPDTMDIPMVDIPTLDKAIAPAIIADSQLSFIFFFSDNIFSA